MWNPEFAIGDSQIDSQHKQLVFTLEGLLKALKTPPSIERQKIFEDTVRFLKNYAVVHFNTEEMYQASIGFTEMEAHRKLHRSFMENMHEREVELIRCGYEEAKVRELADELTRWLIYHILKEDKKMAKEAYRGPKSQTAEMIL